MELGSLLILLLVLACPLMMVWMMRGGHGHGSHTAGHTHEQGASETGDAGSLDDLRRQRAELDVEIARLEVDEDKAETATPAAV